MAEFLSKYLFMLAAISDFVTIHCNYLSYHHFYRITIKTHTDMAGQNLNFDRVFKSTEKGLWPTAKCQLKDVAFLFPAKCNSKCHFAYVF